MTKRDVSHAKLVLDLIGERGSSTSILSFPRRRESRRAGEIEVGIEFVIRKKSIIEMELLILYTGPPLSRG
jgi:hypothetical protein